MVSKIAAARIANAAGAHLAIASGRIDRPLSTEARHTLFAAGRGASARKAWLAGGPTAKGREIGRAHVCTPVTNAPPVCRRLHDKKKPRHAAKRVSHTIV